jgi:hypothetical protein
MTGPSVWAVREDDKLVTSPVYRACWEVYQRLTTA